jgi:phosphoglycolate phosphatase (TIGR01487 family)
MSSEARIAAVAADYDGTVADEGKVGDPVLSALRSFRGSGRRLVLVTGRELGELLQVFPEVGVFDRVVAENGALLFDPATRKERLLGNPPPALLVERLRRAGVSPISVGRSIVATVTAFQGEVLAAIRELNLRLEVSLNKGAIMILPEGVNKGSGLRVALEDLSLSAKDTAAIGDGENDVRLFEACGFGIALSNSVAQLKKRADFITSRPAGKGVIEGIRWLMQND